MDPNRVLIFDTTLRDGEQSPGISLNTTEKLEIAHQLARLGVDIIEAGFPIASPGDFEAVQAIAREVEGPIIAGLARANPTDIERAWDAVKDAARPRIHTFVSTSDIHIEHQMQNTREDVQGPRARGGRAGASGYCDDVEFSPMDATRADVEFTAEVCQIAIDEGATTINIPDTVGYTMPDEYTRFLERLYEFAPGLKDVVVSTHCHDDLGLAVANSFAGVLAGARQVECAINGIGERAGNASLEEIVMLLHTRGADLDGLHTGVVTTELARTSRLVSRLTGYVVQPNKAIVGRNAFAHESGHPPGRRAQGAHDVRDHGRDDGRPRREPDRARQALRPPRAAPGARGARLHGRRPGAEHGVQALQGDRGQEEAGHRDGPRGARHRRAARGDDRLRARELRGRGLVDAPAARDGRGAAARAASAASGSFTGDGPIDAVFHAINAATGIDARLREYRVDAVTEGQDALGEVSVVLELEGQSAAGQGVSTDIIEASGRAYLRALSLAVAKAARGEQPKPKPEQPEPQPAPAS